MGVTPFCFLRATYYRWAQQFGDLEKQTSKAPTVLAVGDLHLENFGTWRDGLGGSPGESTILTRHIRCRTPTTWCGLATSALLAIDQDHLSITPSRPVGRLWKDIGKG